MAIPTGSGSEVLKSITQAITSAYTLTPTQHHIYTILNIVLKNEHDATSTFDIEVSNNSGTNYVWLIENHSFVQDATFVWNDRIVLYDNTARLRITGSGGNDLQFCINYIDQNWS